MPPLYSKTMKVDKGNGARFEECELYFYRHYLLYYHPLLPLLSLLLSCDILECGSHCEELISRFIIRIPIILDAVRVSVEGYF